ncbi:MAG: hypothetical protein F7B06_06850, partial [Opitutae bacterium]|nr:hypothetical protein [Opitutae bacterium]
MDRLNELIDQLVGAGLSRDLFDASTLVPSNLSAGFRCDFSKAGKGVTGPLANDTPLPSNFATHGSLPWPLAPDHFGKTNCRSSFTPRSALDAKGIVFATDSEIFARPRKRIVGAGSSRDFSARKIAQPQQVDQLLDFSELVEGDYLVHLQNGICIYRGLSRIDVGQGSREVISLEFDDGIILHLPLHESHLVTRYVGLKKYRPTLGKVGSSRWEKTRRRAEEATLDFAARLLQNQANRDSRKGFAFSADGNWQRDFEATFPYRETPDQLEAIIATKKDQEKPHPMDRLICGDVGFGKT